jgi:phage-related protein
MIGGRIISTRHDGAYLRLWVVDTDDASGDLRYFLNEERAIYIVVSEEAPTVGDLIWWQSNVAYWTPVDERFTDRAVRMVGMCGV